VKGVARINFVFAIHFHQPAGQLKWINERIHENSYKLLLEMFKKYSDLKFTVHVSGPLLLYMMEHHPDWLSELAKLGDYGTVEFMAGSLGEAILPLLPYDDRLAQIREYLRIFERVFSYKPRGLWLPERVWEPHLPEPLAKAGIEYVLVDDSLIYRAGRGEPDNYYAWQVEDGGYAVKLLFIDTGLRYILPWKSSSEVVDYMAGKASGEGDRVIVWGSDAEKFGEWVDPNWARSWLEDFLSTMRRVRDRISMIHPSEYFREHGVRGLLYLPPGSYDKMLEWSGGFFRNFLVKYRESNNMHKKMLWVKRKLASMPVYDEEAWKHYLLGQCNDPYWHGLFGGIYLAHLRQAVYENYLVAERVAEKATGYYAYSDTIVKYVDFDYDGKLEVLVEKPSMNLYIKPDDGGTVFEFDIKEKGFEHNVQDTMTRYMEPYLENTGFNPDWYRRVSLRVHLWSPDTSLDDWINNKPFADKSDLALHNYAVSLTPSKEVVLRTTGKFYGSTVSSVYVEKRIKISSYGYETAFTVENLGDGVVDALIAFEYHVAPKINREDPGAEITYTTDSKHSVWEKYAGLAKRVVVSTKGYPDIVLEQSGSAEVWVAPLTSKARTEKGLQDILQGLAVMFVERCKLARGEKVVNTIKHYVSIGG